VALQGDLILFQKAIGGERIADNWYAIRQAKSLVDITRHNLHDRLAVTTGRVDIVATGVVSDLAGEGLLPHMGRIAVLSTSAPVQYLRKH